MRHFPNKTFSLLLVLAIFSVSFMPFSAPRAEAQLDDLFGGINQEEILEVGAAGVSACAIVAALVKGLQVALAALNISVPTEDTTLNYKELFLDCVVYQVINTIIDDITDSIVQWIQGGFDGNPVFVTNLRRFYTDIANSVASSFIGTDLEFLCSPFRNQIQIALAQRYRSRPFFQCSLGTVIGNIDGFLRGDFSQGGWSGWYQFTQVPQNNPYGAYVQAEGELFARIAEAVGVERERLNQGRGFLSFQVQDCYSVVPDPNNPSATTTVSTDPNNRPDNALESFCDEPRTATPGSVIEEQVNFSLGSPTRRLEIADDINEIMNALLAYFLSDVLTGESGLAGYNRTDFEHEFPEFDLPDISVPGSNPTTPNDDQPPGPLGPSTCFAANGTFLAPTPQNGEGFIDLPLPQFTSYNRIELDLDVTNGGFTPVTSEQRYNIFWLVRERNRDMFGYVPFNGPSQNNLVLRHGIGQVHGSKARRSASLQFPQGSTYHFNYRYDVVTNTVALTVTDTATGNTVANLTSTPDVPGINVGNEQFLVGFSFPYPNYPGNLVEVPSLDWEYQNLRIAFIGEGAVPSSCIQTNVSDTPSNPQLPRGPGGGEPSPNTRVDF